VGIHSTIGNKTNDAFIPIITVSTGYQLTYADPGSQNSQFSSKNV